MLNPLHVVADDEADTRPPAPHGESQSAPHELSRAELLAQVAMLEGKLLTLPAIEQAKGALMATYGLTDEAAFALLRFHSQTLNVKVRAIAAQLTTLMCTTPSSSEALTRFDRLLAQVADSLRTTPAPASVRPQTVGRSPVPIAVDADLPQMMLRAVATAPPGITIAAYAPGMPLIYANDAFTDTTGYSLAEVLGRNCKFLQGVDTDPDRISEIRQALQAGRDFSVVLRNYRRDGSGFWNQLSISPIRDRTEQITHFIGTQIEVSGRVIPGT